MSTLPNATFIMMVCVVCLCWARAAPTQHERYHRVFRDIYFIAARVTLKLHFQVCVHNVEASHNECVSDVNIISVRSNLLVQLFYRRALRRTTRTHTYLFKQHYRTFALFVFLMCQASKINGMQTAIKFKKTIFSLIEFISLQWNCQKYKFKVGKFATNISHFT